MCDVWSTTCESFYENIFLLVPDHYEILTLRTFLKGFTCNLALDQSKKPPCTWTTLGHHLGRALHFAWCSPIMRWPNIMFSKSVFYDLFSRRHKCRIRECFESSGCQLEWQTQYLNQKYSVWSHLLNFFHVLNDLHDLPTFSIFSHPGWQDGTTCRALHLGKLITLWNYDKSNYQVIWQAKMFFLHNYNCLLAMPSSNCSELTTTWHVREAVKNVLADFAR